MFGLYLISILDGLKVILGFVAGFMLLVALLKFAAYLEFGEYEEVKNRYKFLIIGIILIILNVLIPSTKTAYLIYGIDSTLDCLRSNDTVKQLPDKAVIALDKWLDSVSDTTKIKK